MNEAASTEQADELAETVGESDQPTGTMPEEIDLDAVDRDLTGVERALERLADGTYWTDELTGAPLDDTTLASDPTARRSTV